MHDVVVAFIDRAEVESDDNVASGFRGIGALGFGDGNNRMARLANGIQIVGPFNSTGVSNTASRALIFVCDPTKDWRARLRQADYGKPGAARVPPAGDRG